MPPMLPGQVRSAAILDPIPEPFFEPTDATFKTQEIFVHQRERQASVLVLLAGHAGSSGLDQALGFRLGYVRDLGDLLRRSFQELRRRWVLADQLEHPLAHVAPQVLHQLRVSALQERLQLIFELHGLVDHALGLTNKCA